MDKFLTFFHGGEEGAGYTATTRRDLVENRQGDKSGEPQLCGGGCGGVLDLDKVVYPHTKEGCYAGSAYCPDCLDKWVHKTPLSQGKCPICKLPMALVSADGYDGYDGDDVEDAGGALAPPGDPIVGRQPTGTRGDPIVVED